MSPRFLANAEGKIIMVQVPLKYWQQLERKAQAYDKAVSIQNGLEEVALIEKGELKPKSFTDLWNEL
jgi:hypothetical protein